MSPEWQIIIDVVYQYGDTGFFTGVMALIGKIYFDRSEKRRAKESEENETRIAKIEASAKDNTQENENFANLIESNKTVSLQLITSIRDLASQQEATRKSNERIANDAEKTHREIAQAQTSALDTNTQTINQLKETLVMSSDSTNGIKEQLVEMTKRIDNLSSIRTAEFEQISEIIKSLNILLDKMQSNQPKHQTVPTDKIESEDTHGSNS